MPRVQDALSSARDDDGVCKVQGRTKVRFGDGRRYTTRTVDGQVACSIKTFGDPAYNKRKHFEVHATADDGHAASGWQPRTEEGARCEFSGRAQVRYGTAGRYVYRDAHGSVFCDSGSFGNDPYVNASSASRSGADALPVGPACRLLSGRAGSTGSRRS